MNVKWTVEALNDLEEIELIYLKYMRARISYVGLQRKERFFVPEAALRETLLNALCHTQYNYGVPIQISVYEDKLYINIIYLVLMDVVKNIHILQV